MKHTLLLKEEAIEDMTDAFNWYEQKQTGLGVKFFDEVERYFDLITRIHNNINHTGSRGSRCCIVFLTRLFMKLRMKQ